MAASAGAIRVLIAAGGTGGHLYPGIAIAEEWMRLHPDSKVLFVGTSRGPETKAVPRAGFTLETIAARGLPRRPGIGWIQAAYGLAKGMVQTFRLIVDFRPHVVVGTGSYVSAPAVLGVISLLILRQPNLGSTIALLVTGFLMLHLGSCYKIKGAPMRRSDWIRGSGRSSCSEGAAEPRASTARPRGRSSS